MAMWTWRTSCGESAELGFAIGDSHRWGEGLGTAVAAAMIAHGFADLQLRCIRAAVHETNARSLAVVRKLGFEEVGVLDTEEYCGAMVTVKQFVRSHYP